MDIGGAIKRHASAMALQLGQPRMGTVKSVDPNTYTAKVMIEPDGVLTNWLPIAAQAIGNGWGIVCPPNVGDQVIMIPHDGDADNLVIIACIYSQQQVPPSGAKSGEFWLVHQLGAYIKLTNDGQIHSHATWNHTGDFLATGRVIAGYGTSDQVALQTHTHDQPNDSAGDGEAATYAPNAGT